MKKFILKKDLPLAKAGTEVTISSYPNDESAINMILESELHTKHIADIQTKDIPEWLEEVKVNKRWRADIQDIYYYINHCGEIDDSYEDNDESDNFRYRTRNYFQTQEQAQKYLDYINVVATLNDIIDEENGDWIPDYKNDDCKHSVVFDNQNNQYLVDVYRKVNSRPVISEIRTQEIAKKIINNHKDLLDIIFNY